MGSLRFFITLLIAIAAAVTFADCELEEYFKWKHITFASNNKGNCKTNWQIFDFCFTVHCANKMG